jgi:very-short-patch-repair endonuclease
MCDQRATADAVIAGLAARQHGVVSVDQLRAAGLDKHRVAHRVRTRRLHPVHRGVYAVGHVGLELEGRWMAAVLACGHGAVLSHRSAAALWRLLRPTEGPIEVTVPTQAGRKKRRGIRLHRCSTLAVGDEALSSRYAGGRRLAPLVTVRSRIPVTTVARTIDDLRGAVPPYLVRRAIRQAELVGLRLDGVEADRTRSDLERDFLRLCRCHGLPRPEVNVRVGRLTVDFLWRSERLAVETDSFAYHRGSVAFEDDHARDLDLRARGFAIRRFTERQLEDEPERVAADVAEGLGRPIAVSHHVRG